jgi:hypothetical protein
MTVKISPSDLKGLVRLAGEHAEKILIKEGQKELLSTYLLLRPGPDDDIEIEVIGCVWRSGFEKQLAILAVKKRAREFGATALSFVAEVWMASRPIARPQFDLPASEDPQRREVVVAVATNGKDREACCWQIVRNRPGGRIISLVESPIAGDGFSGRIIDGILP